MVSRSLAHDFTSLPSGALKWSVWKLNLLPRPNPVVRAHVNPLGFRDNAASEAVLDVRIDALRPVVTAR